jgi:hypothetical protein
VNRREVFKLLALAPASLPLAKAALGALEPIPWYEQPGYGLPFPLEPYGSCEEARRELSYVGREEAEMDWQEILKRKEVDWCKLEMRYR